MTDGRGRGASPSSRQLGALRRAKDLLDRAYAEPIVVDDLARAAGCSRFHFSRSFARVYGQTPGRTLTRRRIERAQELLRAANLSVTEVCMAVGFSSLGSFSSRFKALTGQSPSEYRAAAVRGGGPPPIPGCFVLMWAGPAPDARPAIPPGRRRALLEKRRPPPRATVLVEPLAEDTP
ncbi:MAG TPA: AraC family transcriptional regulator [Candidatus Micrarchaeia archaeon]|nr:AraC family transcriptional regulator [Candidatus Micrarchaeia archaeon]